LSVDRWRAEVIGGTGSPLKSRFFQPGLVTVCYHDGRRTPRVPPVFWSFRKGLGMNPRCSNVVAFLLPTLLVTFSTSWCPQSLAAPQEAADADRTTEAAAEAVATKTARVNVVDASGDSVADASVVVQLNYPHTSLSLKADDAGSAVFDVPEEARIIAVAAWKDHEGLDYRSYELPRQQQADALAVPPGFPFDDAQTLLLDGAAPLTVRIVDDQQHPLQDVRVYPWLLHKESEGRELNLSFFTKDVAQSTDSEGLTTFAWFPAWQKSLVTVWPDAAGFVRERGAYDPLTSDGQLEITLPRLVAIRGRAVDLAPLLGFGSGEVRHSQGRHQLRPFGAAK
jgi:hypothetical protein